MRPLKVRSKKIKKMPDTNSKENKNKIPYRMSRVAWPKAKYGAVLAVILLVIINLIYYKDAIFSLIK